MISAVRAAMRAYDEYATTEGGARVKTHCLFPSFEPVYVYVAGMGEGFHVHDGGAAHAIAWDHGRDARIVGKYLGEAATRYGLTVDNSTLLARIETPDWLPSAILSVANASSHAAGAAVEHAARAATETLQARIFDTLVHHFTKDHVVKDYERVGGSGKTHTFDFALVERDRIVVVDAVSPHPVSVAARYTAFSDTRATDRARGLAVFDRALAAPDKTLLNQVAEVVPFKSLKPGVQRALAHG